MNFINPRGPDELPVELPALRLRELPFKDRVVGKINSWINLPFMDEVEEQRLFSQMYDFIVDDVLGIGRSTNRELKEKVVSFVNGWVNIPVLPEGIEAMIFGFIYDLIVRLINDHLLNEPES